MLFSAYRPAPSFKTSAQETVPHRSPSPPRGQAGDLIAHWTPEFLAAASATHKTYKQYCENAANEVGTFAKTLYDSEDFVWLFRRNRQRDLLDRIFLRAHHLDRCVDFKAIGHDPGRYTFSVQFVPRAESVDRAAAIGSRSVHVDVHQPSNVRAFEKLKASGMPEPSLIVHYPDGLGVRAYLRTDRLLTPEEFTLVQGALSLVVNGSPWKGNVDDACNLPGLNVGDPHFCTPVIVAAPSRQVYLAQHLMDQLSELLDRRRAVSKR